jgi:hypothetical protein
VGKKAKKIAIWTGGTLLAIGVLGVGITKYLSSREPVIEGGPTTMRLISADQYRNTVAYVFGSDIQVAVNFPLLQRRNGLVSLGATIAAMTPGDLEQFDKAARSIATQVIDSAHRDTLIPCVPRDPNGADTKCSQAFFSKVGRFLYRRPLSPNELQLQVAIADSAAKDRRDFYQGIAYGLSGLMTSPKFLYITETSEADPDRPGQYRLDDYSLASRLSLFLWNALPDDELLTAAEKGELRDRAGLSHQIDRMIASPRLEEGVRGFFADLLQLQDFESLSKDPVIYPDFTFQAAQSVHEQLMRTITDYLLRRNGDYRGLFTTNETFVNRALGPLYRTQVPTQTADEWTPYEQNGDESAGVLTSLSFLAAHAHPGRSSPTRRGRAIREIFLCQKIPDPPPTVNFTVFENMSKKLTARDRLKAHALDSSCAGCHNLTDPVGLAFEKYDGAGEFRTREHNVIIDTSGMFDGNKIGGVADVGRVMHDHPALIPCIARRVYGYSVGRDPGIADRRWLSWLARQFAGDSYEFPELLKHIAESEAFYAVSPPPAGATLAAK